MKHTTHTLYDGEWVPEAPPRGRRDSPNFLIVCGYGDWSGFRTLDQCLAQIPSSWEGYEPGFFWIEER